MWLVAVPVLPPSFLCWWTVCKQVAKDYANKYDDFAAIVQPCAMDARNEDLPLSVISMVCMCLVYVQYMCACTAVFVGVCVHVNMYIIIHIQYCV